MLDWLGQVPGFRSNTPWKRAVAVVGYLVILSMMLTRGIAGIVFGVLALLVIAAFGDLFQIRARVPGIGSENKLAQAGSWSALVIATLLAMVVAFPGDGANTGGLPTGPDRDQAVEEAAPTHDIPTVVPPSREQPEPTTTKPLPPTEKPVPATPAPPTEAPSTSTPEPAPIPPAEPPPVDLNPNTDQNCDSFSSYDEMQAWRTYWVDRGVSNPGGLDGDGDGVACEEGEGGRAAAPAQFFAPQPPAPAPPSGLQCIGYRPCGDFSTHAAAQAYFEACGRPSKMDGDGHGSACESLP